MKMNRSVKTVFLRCEKVFIASMYLHGRQMEAGLPLYFGDGGGGGSGPAEGGLKVQRLLEWQAYQMLALAGWDARPTQ